MLENKPLVTIAVICYKQERFVEEAVKSALAQTYSPLEVVVTDDCSPDATFSIIEKVVSEYTGPHKVIIHRNEKNLGLAGNVNKAWDLSSGEFFVSQGGDDVSLPHRTSTLVDAWLSRDPRPDLVYSGVVLIDEDGNELAKNTQVAEATPPIDDTITGRKIFIAGGCAAAYPRSLHYFTGPLNVGVMAEDFVYSFRALLGNGVVGISEPLVLYRQNSASIIGQLKSARENNYRGEDKYLKADIIELLEHKRAMDAYKVKRPYLRWRLARRINSMKMELRFSNSGVAIRWLLMIWSLCSLRFRLFSKMLNVLVVPTTKHEEIKTRA
jgi:glycosyltransferase involved in cell wall biosynthesis